MCEVQLGKLGIRAMWVDRIVGMAGLVTLSPVMALCAIAIIIEDGAPVIFVQQRVGKNGRPFRLFKLRSMRTAPTSTQVTASI